MVLFVVAVEDGTDNSIDAGGVDDAALDNVGDAQRAPEVPREIEKGQQLRQILLQLFQHRRVWLPPEGAETPPHLAY